MIFFFFFSYSAPIKGITFCAESVQIRVDFLNDVRCQENIQSVKSAQSICILSLKPKPYPFSRGVIMNVKRSYTHRESFNMYQSCNLQKWKSLFIFRANFILFIFNYIFLLVLKYFFHYYLCQLPTNIRDLRVTKLGTNLVFTRL